MDYSMNKPNIKPNPPTWLKIDAVEERYKAKFVGEFAIPTKDGKFSEIPWPVFYQANPDLVQGHKHYFALILQETNVYIIDASFIEGKLITAVKANDGEVIYSKAVHDFVSSKDDSVWIDGGFDYTRYGFSRMSVSPIPFLVTIKNGEFVYPSEAANADKVTEEDNFQYKGVQE